MGLQSSDAIGPQRINKLRDAFGQEIELVSDDDSGTEKFRILAEYSLNGGEYAALQTPAMRKADDIAFFRIATESDGTLGLASIDDEEEWEIVSEGYDELLFESSANE